RVPQGEPAGPLADERGRGRRLGRAARADAGVRRDRRDDHPRLGHDRDLAAGLRLAAARGDRGRAALELPGSAGPLPGHGAHPAVAEAAAIGVPDEKWDERPLVAVVLAEGQQATADELRSFLADKVAKWQVPENWAFIEEVPKTSVGKFDKKRLRAAFAEGKL